MKLLTEDGPFIPKHKIKQIAIATSIMVLTLYTVAMVFSLCGSDMFILKYENAWFDKVEAWFRARNIMSVINYLFSTVEFAIILTFIIQKRPKIYWIIGFYLPVAIVADRVNIPRIAYTLYPFLFYLLVPLAECGTKQYWKRLIRLLIAVVVSIGLQAMIEVIKSGYFDGENHIFTLPSTFMYSIEYDIALVVMLYTSALLLNREKGDNVWTVHQQAGGSSQQSKTKSQRLSLKNLPKNKQNKIRLLYIRTYFIQIGAFLLVMILPFLLGKVFEFLVMYFSFAIVRYILGFNYSLHFKKEAICVSVSVLIFGILSLVVPFFYVVLIVAITLGIALAIVLHLSYKYRAMFLFMQVVNTDRYAFLYVAFDGDTTPKHVLTMCIYYGLDKETAEIVNGFMQKEKISYLALKYHYAQRTICYKIDEAIATINSCI